MPKKKTTEEFIQDAIKVHGDKYDYSKVEYKNSSSKVIIICKEHGEFKQNAGNHIHNKSDCSKCKTRNIKYSIKECQNIAKENKGECLSNKYINKDKKLKWKCKEGHLFEKRLGSINKNSWCPKCSGKKKYTLEEVCQYAITKNGNCLSKEYINLSTKMEWKCKEGHIWENTFGHIKDGQWCPYCSGKYNNNIKLCKEIAISQGGECLSKEYINSSTKMKWKCKEGHIWNTNFENIKLSNSWCPICSGNISYNISFCIKYVAENFNGKCLSREYKNSKEYMLWKCEKNHIFESKFYNVKVRNNWCPKCNMCPSCGFYRTGGELCSSTCNDIAIKKYREKSKEWVVVRYLQEKLPDYDFIHNKSVGSHCTKDEKENSNGHLFPDIRFDCGFYHLIVEVDEHKHRGADYKCDKQRMYDIIAKLGLPCIFIRYNPDSKESNKEILLEKVQEYLELNIEDDDRWDDFGFKAEYLFY